MWIVISKRTLILWLMIIITVATFSTTVVLSHKKSAISVNARNKAYVAIVIDDFGNNGEGTSAMLQLGIPITAAVMPFLPYTATDAGLAHSAGFEVIMHVPMEPEYGDTSWLGPGGITVDVPEDEILRRITLGLEQIRWAVGMNNHMGSKITQNRQIMRLILQEAKIKELFFLDSRTTLKTLIASVADELGVAHVNRDVFLDNSKNKSDIKNQLQALANLALKNGFAVGIGHVGPEGGTVTAEAIKDMYPHMVEQGIEFVFLSQIAELRGWQSASNNTKKSPLLETAK